MVSCSGCTLCCRHVSVEVDPPSNEDEVDEYLWMLLHEGVGVYIDDDEWYVEFKTKCKALTDEGRCRIYDRRPKMCATYDPNECVSNGGDSWYDVYFSTPEELSEYWEKKQKKEGE